MSVLCSYHTSNDENNTTSTSNKLLYNFYYFLIQNRTGEEGGRRRNEATITELKSCYILITFPIVDETLKFTESLYV